LLKERPLSIAQERLWVLDQLHSHNLIQNLSCGLHIPEAVDRESVQAALDELQRLHEILRTEFHAVDGAPVQVVSELTPLTLATIDLRHFPQQERKSQLVRLRQQETKTPFDLTRGPAWRATLFQLGETESVLLVTAHLIVCDEVSIRLLLSEVKTLYEARRSGKPSERTMALQYFEVAARKAVREDEHVSYWKQRLEGAPSSVDVPNDRPRPAVQTFRSEQQRLCVEADLSEKVRILAKSFDTSLSTMLVAVFTVLLSRYSRQDDLVIGMRISGRVCPELEKVIGPLESLLALRIDASGDPIFSDFVTRVRKGTEEAFLHQDVPFQTVLKQLRLERDMSRHPLFQIMFTPPRSMDAAFESAGGERFLEVESAAEQFDLSLGIATEENRMEVCFTYNPDLFDASTIERLCSHFRVLLHSAVDNPGLNISRMPLLAGSERDQLLVEWNDTRVDYPRNQPLHKFIEEQVEKTPDACAVMYESEHLTYRELNNRANQLAHYLRKHGVGPDVLVTVCLHRSLDLVTALLAILKAGGAYVPLDPEYPKDRLETMLRDVNPPVVLTQRNLLSQLPNDVPHVFCFDRDWSSAASESPQNPTVTVNGKNLAYAIYTSGSTGKPKGVPNVHEGIVNRLLWMQDAYQLTARDRVLQKTPFSFDVSVWEFFWPLMSGATLVVAIPGGHRDSAYLANLIAEQGITTLHFVPSMLSIFLEADGLERCRALRHVFASGEALPFELQQRFFERLGCELHNLYGPTEASVDVTYWACRPNNQQAIVPIGRPIANTEIYILDANLQPVPIGVAGELHIGGVGLARGYLNRPDLTAQKFIANPFSNKSGTRLYKTGDLARFLSDGNIEYLGRIDHQVKLRGFRIELGEIEAVLGELGGVRQAVVSVREDRPGDKKLVAYLIASPGQELGVERLRRALRDKLPEHMVPSKFVILENFPMTTSGKVDRKALPAPREQEQSVAVVLPRNELESKLASVFANVLGVASVNITDNFFDLGGHSLTAARLLAQVKEITGREVPLSLLFRGATVESLAQLIGEHREASEPVMMEIQAGENGRLPFFAIVPPAEEALGYAILARHMGLDQPLYKIQGHAPIVGKRPYTEQEMKALASEYASAMRSVQPEGPYCLGGLCDGAHIAEHVVLELEAQGEEVALFAVIDTWVLQNSQRPLLWRVDYFHQRLREARKRNFGEQINLYKRAIKNRIRRFTGKVPARTDWQEAYWPSNYVPPRFRAPVMLFKRPKQPFYYVKDALMGWGQRTDGRVEIHEIDFDHLYLLREPHVGVLGKKLAGCIERVRSQRGQTPDPAENFPPGMK
jgi:amino acid adenylation domain-containing protein